MGERKGLSKYYPPDFDPSKLSRVKRPKNRLKFNAKKSTADETYLGTKIFRFSMKCKACPAAFIIKTDPKNADYTCESGAKRNFEAWRADKEAENEAKAVREEQDMDTMQALENKTLDARKEMEDLDELDDLRTRNALAAKVSAELLFERHRDNHSLGRGAKGVPSDAELAEQARAAFSERAASRRKVNVDFPHLDRDAQKSTEREKSVVRKRPKATSVISVVRKKPKLLEVPDGKPSGSPTQASSSLPVTSDKASCCPIPTKSSEEKPGTATAVAPGSSLVAYAVSDDDSRSDSE